MIIGIDLGTTNSLAAYYTDEGPKIIPNRLGERLTPSAVSIDENDQVYVGRSALERMAVHPEQGASLSGAWAAGRNFSWAEGHFLRKICPPLCFVP